MEALSIKVELTFHEASASYLQLRLTVKWQHDGFQLWEAHLSLGRLQIYQTNHYYNTVYTWVEDAEKHNVWASAENTKRKAENVGKALEQIVTPAQLRAY